jgi:UMF1 family MFS transporter
VSGRSREVWAWAFYDFANSAFTTLVVTFIYSTWYASAMTEATPIPAKEIWLWGIAASSVLIALLSPLIGTMADRNATRLRWFRTTSISAIALCTALAFVPVPYWLTALVLFVAANTIYEVALALYNSFLPALADDGKVGRISGSAWALGYVGGLLCLVVGFLFTGLPGGAIEPLLSTDDGWNIRATNLLVAGWYLVFALPALLLLREPGPPDPTASASPAKFKETFRKLLEYPEALKLLVARILYNDGLVTLIAFGGIYAKQTLDFGFAEIVAFGIWLNVAAGIGAAGFGFLDDKLGGKSTVMMTIVGLTLATAGASLTTTATGFWIAGTVIGLLLGPNQAASRSLLSRMIPKEKTGEFFGFFAFSGKITAFLGPATLPIVIRATGSDRIGVASLSIFFILGGLLLLRVDEKAGMRAAGRRPGEETAE